MTRDDLHKLVDQLPDNRLAEAEALLKDLVEDEDDEQERRSGWQAMMYALLPESLAKNIEAESRRWMIRCSQCSHEQSVWDIGGIRYKAKGNPRTMTMCGGCRKFTWHTFQLR